MDLRSTVVTAALTWTGETFERNVQIRIDANGQIVDIGKEIVNSNETLTDLGSKVLLPGFVNAHSHAFHRFMRGRSQIGSLSSDSFWKWRDDMYSMVENINRKQLYEYALVTFKEMLSAGITTVGEFHYVHHSDEKKFDLDYAILDAARDAQIRIVLIDTLYCRAGFGSEQLASAQKRFVATFDEFTDSVQKLDEYKSVNQTIAVSAHSLRAVSLEDCVKLSEWSKTNSKPLHIHVEEQPKEISDCESVNNLTPSQLLLYSIANDDVLLTCVHCTFTSANQMSVYAQRGTNICVCPLTEGYLGDGIPNIVDNNTICLGTDCNNRICMLEEMRWLAYCQHMKRNSRRVCGLNARKLLRIATENGARSLGLKESVGRFEVGMEMDFVGFDLLSHRIKSIPADEMLDAIVFGAGNDEICMTAVGGRVVYDKQNRS